MQHCIENLCYQLVPGQVRLEPLRILALREIEWNGWTVAFHVLGASHAITLKRDDICITELFTCATVATSVPVVAQSQGKLPITLCLNVPGLDCRIRLERFSLSDGDALRRDVPESDRLVVAFPHAPGDIAPITRLGWQVTEQSLRIETIHTYPEERSGVRSVTVFEVVVVNQRSQFHAS